MSPSSCSRDGAKTHHDSRFPSREGKRTGSSSFTFRSTFALISSTPSMGRCGGDEDEDVLKQLLPSISDLDLNPDVSLSSSSSYSQGVLSPMNSNFLALVSPDLLRAILELLPPADLARSACVCRMWRAVASEREMKEWAFRVPWKVRRVLGEPSSVAFWRHPGLDRFAISHRLRRGDTVPGLALRYSVQVLSSLGSSVLLLYRRSVVRGRSGCNGLICYDLHPIE
ncbi:hypothetical protein GW17_00052893 [Ensete ventricosum]|nr:hypothetical protein GW17_00052893 [Ensete ventricosum]